MMPIHENSLSETIALLLAEIETETVSIGDLIEFFGSRAYGVLIILFALPSLLPGIAALTGFALLIFSLQMAIGIGKPFMPAFIANYKIEKSALEKAVHLVSKYLLKIEKYFLPRYTYLNKKPAIRLMGLVVAVQAFLIMIPLPLSNLFPSIFLILLAISILQKDGLMAFLSCLIAIAYTVAYALVAYIFLQQLISYFSS